MTSQGSSEPYLTPGTPGWAVTNEANWSYMPAVIGVLLAIILFPALYLIGQLPHRSDPGVVYPALREQMTAPNGATAGQPSIPQTGK